MTDTTDTDTPTENNEKKTTNSLPKADKRKIFPYAFA